ncbi:MAG: SUMF1/EgtB/PvdO family nonheme iron enzyme [Capsulimonadaceae bacterium]
MQSLHLTHHSSPWNRSSFIFLALLLAMIPAIPTGAQTSLKDLVETPIADAPSYAKYAVVIGITDYDSCQRLHDCNNDARDFANLLRANFGFQNVVLMTDDPETDPSLRPTQRNITKALNTMYSGIIRDKSEVVFFFSGHGTRARDAAGADTDWIVPEDGDPADVPGTCINYDAIRQRLATLLPRRALLFTDACRNLLGDKSLDKNGFGTGLRSVGLGPEVAQLQSCLPTESSLEGRPEDFAESVFTHYLIKGLSGDPDAVDPGTHTITFDSLKQYIQYSVHAYAAKLNSVQTPDGTATLGRMELAKYALEGPPTLTPAVKPDDPMAHLRITGVPAGATITLDGVPQTAPNIDVDLRGADSKSVKLVVVADNYKTYMAAVPLESGFTTNLPITLDHEPTAPPVPLSYQPASPSTASKMKVNRIDGAEMVYVPGGPFQMGDSDRSDNPVHTVTLSSYYIYKNDVTVEMYKNFCAATGRAMPPEPPWGWDNGSYPIVNVTWNDAKAYCDWAGVHLPTEAQWEKAARGTDGRQYPWGNDWDPSRCANSVSSNHGPSPMPVGSYPSGASIYGAMDMAGNVWNWCSDWYNADYCKSDHGSDPAGPDGGSRRVLRGGSGATKYPGLFRASYRNNLAPDNYYNNYGLRGAASEP